MASGDVLLSRLVTSIVVSLGASNADLRDHRQQLNETAEASRAVGGAYRQMAEQVGAAYQDTGAAAGRAAREQREAGQAAAQSLGQLGDRALEARVRQIQLAEEIRTVTQRLRELNKQEEDIDFGEGMESFAGSISDTEENLARLKQELASVNREVLQLERGMEGAERAEAGFARDAGQAASAQNMFSRAAQESLASMRAQESQLTQLRATIRQLETADVRMGGDSNLGPVIEQARNQYAALKTTLQETQREYVNLQRGASAVNRAEQEVAEGAGAAGGAMTEQARQAQALAERLQQLRVQMNELRTAERDIRAAQQTSMGDSVSPLLQANLAQQAAVQREASATRRSLNELERDAGNSGRGFLLGAAGIGSFYTALIAVQAVVGVVEGAVRGYADFNTELTKTAALTETTASDLGAMGQAARQLSVDTGRPLKELAEGIYTIQSVSRGGAENIQLLAASAKASSIGFGTTKEVVDLLTVSQHNYNLSVGETVGLLDPLTVAIVRGRGEAREYTNSLGSVIPVAQRMGATFQETAALLSVMSLGQANSARNATELREIYQSFERIRPGTDAAKALNEVGLSVESLTQMLHQNGLVATLLELERRFQGNDAQLERVIPNIRGFTGAMRLTSDGGRAYIEVMDGMGRQTGEFNRRYEIGSTGVQRQSDRLGAALANVGTSMAERLIPHLLPAAGGIAAMLDPTRKEGDAFEAWGTSIHNFLIEYDKFVGKLPGFLQPAGGMGQGGDKTQPPPTPGLQTPGRIGLGLGQGYPKQGPMDADALNAYLGIPKQDDIERMFGITAQAVTDGSSAVTDALSEGSDRFATAAERDQAVFEAAFAEGSRRALIGKSEEEFLKAIDDYITKPFEDGGQKALEAAALLEGTIEQAWQNALSPEKAEAQIRQLRAARQRIQQATTAEETAAARAALGTLIIGFGQEASDKRGEQNKEREAAQQRADDRRKAADREREAREAQEHLYQSIVAGLEEHRFDIQEAYGRVGDQAVSTMVSALSGARTGKTTEPIMQAQARLAQQFREAGIANWQQVAGEVGQAYLDALAQKISPQEAASVLQQALTNIPRLNLQTLVEGTGAGHGIDREALLQLGGTAGTSLIEGMETALREGGEKSIAQVRRSAIGILRETEKISDPELAYQRANEFWQQFIAATEDGSQEALNGLEQFVAEWNRNVKLDQAKLQFTERTDQGRAERDRAQAEATTEATRQMGEIIRGIGEEQGTEGLTRFFGNMNQYLGDTPKLLERVQTEIGKVYTSLDDPQGFRKARELFQREMDARLENFREEQYKEQLIFQQGEEAKRRELAHTRQQEDVARQQAREDAQIALGISREEQDEVRHRQREDAQASREIAKELAEAQKRGASPAELGQISQRGSDAASERAEQRRYEDEDRGIARVRAAEDVALRRGQAEADRQLGRSREDEDVRLAQAGAQRAHDEQRKMAIALRDEQLQITAQTQAFEDRQAAQRAARQIRNIADAEGVRIAAAETTYQTLFSKEAEHLNHVARDIYDPGWTQVYNSWHERAYIPIQQDIDALVNRALNAGLKGQQQSIQSSETAKDQFNKFLMPDAPADTGPQEVHVVGIDSQPLADLAEAANDHPVLMDGQDVEDVQSKIRRGRFRARSLV